MDDSDDLDSFWTIKMPLLFIIIVIILAIIGWPRSEGISEFKIQCDDLEGITAKAEVPEGYKALICVKRSDVIMERPL